MTSHFGTLKKNTTLEGSGLRNQVLTKAFARMINRKLQCKKNRMECPVSAEELLIELEASGPLPCIYNARAWSAHPSRQIHEHGFDTRPSEIEAEKILAINNDWESLINKQRSIKSTAFSQFID